MVVCIYLQQYWLCCCLVSWVCRQLSGCLFFLAITLVVSAEIFNTAIEVLADKIEPDVHPQIKLVKDLAAGAVLVCATFAVIVGVVIFVPKFFP